jgi:tripartite-type tricarboxylate transporter receptor subunit TctC
MPTRVFGAFVTPVLLVCSTLALAQGYPSKSVTIIVPFPPGGGYDTHARAIAPRLSQILGQPVVVDNRAGAGGTIGLALAARSAADGHTLVVAGAGDIAISPFLYQNLSYDTAKSFAPITMIGQFSLVLAAHPSIPVKTVKDLIALARSKPGHLSYATSSIGSTGHIASEMFKTMAQVDLISVPYKGTGPGIIGLMGGHVATMFAEPGSIMPHVRSGKVRGIAVSTPKRAAGIPEIPTIAESGLPGFDVTGWWGIFAPAGTPQPVIQRLHNEVVAIVKAPEFRSRMESLGAEASGMAIPEFTAKIASDIDKFGKVVKISGARLD